MLSRFLDVAQGYEVHDRDEMQIYCGDGANLFHPYEHGFGNAEAACVIARKIDGVGFNVERESAEPRRQQGEYALGFGCFDRRRQMEEDACRLRDERFRGVKLRIVDGCLDERAACRIERTLGLLDASERKVGVGADEACREAYFGIIASKEAMRNALRSVCIAGEIGEFRAGYFATRSRVEGIDEFAGMARREGRIHEGHEVRMVAWRSPGPLRGVRRRLATGVVGLAGAGGNAP